MEDYYPFWFILTFVLLVWSACKADKDKPYDDEEIDDYWSDGQLDRLDQLK